MIVVVVVVSTVVLQTMEGLQVAVLQLVVKLVD